MVDLDPSNPIDRELLSLQRAARAPRQMRLGCIIISHENFGFCSTCTSSCELEVMSWRLLALKEKVTNGEPGTHSQRT